MKLQTLSQARHDNRLVQKNVTSVFWNKNTLGTFFAVLFLSASVAAQEQGEDRSGEVRTFGVPGDLPSGIHTAAATEQQEKGANGPESGAKTKEGVQEVQRRLQVLGYEPGAADGAMGSKTTAALKKFQSDQGLPATGVADQKTLEALSVRGAEAATEPKTEGAKAPSAAAGQDSAEERGNLTYHRYTIRDGAIIPKDFEDSYEGHGWIAGTVVSAGTHALVVSVPRGRKKEYSVTFDKNTSVCIGQKVAADGLSAVSELEPGQRVSVAFRKGTQTADRIVDESYEITMRLETPTSGKSSGPSMPKCD
ncbi:MAG TPA: peptidoglycan-binding domain-containing protein [Candidatus Acidoferrales bacterium]|nr:peptidoglycan-binding domain-containing protein [Candidatus Acidoferrales bacterium]